MRDTALAAGEFRRGVLAYYRGAFNDAIQLFERALSAAPRNPLILEWLGNAYYRSGIEGAALHQWGAARDLGYGGALLRNKIEVVQQRRDFAPDSADALHFSESESFHAVRRGTVLFRRPLSLCALADGTFWMSAYGSNELLRFDVNGRVIARTRGPVEGFDRPFDVIQTRSGDLLVSEFASDRICRLTKEGRFLKSFGGKGRGVGQLIGPQFLATDRYDNIYVTDFGNARVAVFAPDGAPLFHFGQKSARFFGFSAPGGIAILDELVYVADALKGAIYVFDTAGNYVRTLVAEGTLKHVESVRAWNGRLLVSLPNEVMVVDVGLASLHTIARLGNAPIRLTAAVPDANGNVLLADYKNERIEIVSRISELAGGLFVHFERVHADRFPSVTVNVSVHTREGTPVVGLDVSNFFLTEEHRPVSEMRLQGAAYLNDTCSLSILVDRSPATEQEMRLVTRVIGELAQAVGEQGTLSVVSAAQSPVLEGTFTAAQLQAQPLRLRAKSSSQWRFDLGLRLAAGTLVNADYKRAVVFLSLGELQTQDFAQYGVTDLAAYLTNNETSFYVIQLQRTVLPVELGYLVQKTRGAVYSVYAQEGLGALVAHVRSGAAGTYALSYRSRLPTDFGRAYMPVEAEVRVLSRSGRDETGYFAPLE
ncbi:tetratricopeptide repeat protein [Treponema pallidum]|uniref:tetratricopeptide repeat protein n=1 Tax=Treponema pallidum TaxID=160 RepID=UPI003EB77740